MQDKKELPNRKKWDYKWSSYIFTPVRPILNCDRCSELKLVKERRDGKAAQFYSPRDEKTF